MLHRSQWTFRALRSLKFHAIDRVPDPWHPMLQGRRHHAVLIKSIEIIWNFLKRSWYYSLLDLSIFFAGKNREVYTTLLKLLVICAKFKSTNWVFKIIIAAFNDYIHSSGELSQSNWMFVFSWSRTMSQLSVPSHLGFSFSTQIWHFCTKLTSRVLKSKKKVASSGIWIHNSNHHWIRILTATHSVTKTSVE